jgi:sortase A
MALGLMLLFYSGYVWIETQLYQAMENRELDAILAAGTRSMEASPAAPAGPAVRGRPAAPPARGSVVGRVEIPRLKVAAMIRAGSDSRTLRLAVGHIPGTALPGESGNVGLAGHRDTFFRRLQDIRVEDEVRLVTAEGVYTFRVEKAWVVDPSDVWVLDPTGTPALTLVTCYPFTYIGSAPRRFIVRAVAEDVEHAREAPAESPRAKRLGTS